MKTRILSVLLSFITAVALAQLAPISWTFKCPRCQRLAVFATQPVQQPRCTADGQLMFRQ